MPAASVNKVVIVCTANICRSPCAEILFRHRVGQAVQVQSAGTHALVGSRIDHEMAHRLKSLLGQSASTEIAGHRARQLDDSLARWAQLILVVTREHHAWCLNRFPFLAGRVHHFAAGPELGQSTAADIEDPHQLSDVMYLATLDRLKDGVDLWAGKIL